MKHLKAKLMAAVAMLLVATVMLTSASFAWFTISTNPEVANLSATINSNQNLEIALDDGSETEPDASSYDSTNGGDSGKNETWGNLVDLTTYFKNAGIALKPVIATVAGDSKSISFDYPNFGLDGRIKDVTALNRLQADDVSGTEKFLDFGGIWTHGDKSEDKAENKTGDPVWCFEVDYWLRSNEDQHVGLSVATDRDDATNGEDGLGSWVNDEAVTIAFVDATDGIVYYAKKGEADATTKECALTLVDKDPALDTDKSKAATATIELKANEAKLVRMYVYLNGADLTNEDMIYTSKDFKMNIQFTAMEDENGTTVKNLKSLVVTELEENGRKAS